VELGHRGDTDPVVIFEVGWQGVGAGPAVHIPDHCPDPWHHRPFFPALRTHPTSSQPHPRPATDVPAARTALAWSGPAGQTASGLKRGRGADGPCLDTKVRMNVPLGF